MTGCLIWIRFLRALVNREILWVASVSADLETQLLHSAISQAKALSYLFTTLQLGLGLMRAVRSYGTRFQLKRLPIQMFGCRSDCPDCY